MLDEVGSATCPVMHQSPDEVVCVTDVVTCVLEFSRLADPINEVQEVDPGVHPAHDLATTLRTRTFQGVEHEFKGHCSPSIHLPLLEQASA